MPFSLKIHTFSGTFFHLVLEPHFSVFFRFVSEDIDFGTPSRPRRGPSWLRGTDLSVPENRPGAPFFRSSRHLPPRRPPGAPPGLHSIDFSSIFHAFFMDFRSSFHRFWTHPCLLLPRLPNILSQIFRRVLKICHGFRFPYTFRTQTGDTLRTQTGKPSERK